LNLADVRILIYEESVVTRIESLDASQIMVFLTRAQFLRLKMTRSSFWTVAFNSSQSPAFTNMRQYSRYRFTLMDHIHEIAVPVFPFPHMRSSHCSTIVAFIRSEYELPPCEYCRAVKLSGAFMRCCQGFEQDIGLNLPEPMPTKRRQTNQEFTANGKDSLTMRKDS
jgi:hypothetical protein